MMQMVRADATVIDVEASAICENGGTGRRMRRLAVVEDVTEKRRLTALSHFAVHDALTGLPNRVLLDDRLERACLHHAPPRGDISGWPFWIWSTSSPSTIRTACGLAGDEFVLLLPVVAAAVRHTQHSTHVAHGECGLVRVHEFVDPLDVRGR
jgi:hypothetical protein